MPNLANSVINTAILGSGFVSPLVTDPTTKDWQVAVGGDDIKNCIVDLVTTLVGERVMREDMGTNTLDAVFADPVGLADILPQKYVETIQQYEPRVNRVKCTARVLDKTTVEIALSWTVRSTNRKDNHVFPFYTQPTSGGVSKDY